ncbi:MAG: hypothetical protein ABIQ73_10720 [Acidimicrobiales bacterium]
MNSHFEVSDGVDVVMRLPSVSYGALYRTMLVDRVIEHVEAGDVQAAWVVVGDAVALADSLECSWCDRLGLHEQCWAPRTGASV